MNLPEDVEQKNITLQSEEDVNRPGSVITNIGLYLLELIKVAVLAGLTIWFVRYFLFKPFYVKGQSMEPTFDNHQYLIVDELSYRFRDPARGEVIVFKAPVNEEDFYLKRIVGLPGERVKIADNKVVIYNEKHPEGVMLKEEYLVENTTGVISLTLADDEYFVMGDNRDASYDSRRFGAIKKDSLVGRAWFRGWPLNKIGVFSAPNYNF